MAIDACSRRFISAKSALHSFGAPSLAKSPARGGGLAIARHLRCYSGWALIARSTLAANFRNDLTAPARFPARIRPFGPIWRSRVYAALRHK